MKHFLLVFLFLVAGLILATMLSCGEPDGAQDDPSASSGQASADDAADDEVVDDDAAGDDAADDDLTDDDSSNDDAADDDPSASSGLAQTDDDTSPPVMSSRLLLVIDDYNNNRIRSLIQTESGWQALPVPQQGSSRPYWEYLGPVLMLNGSQGYSAVNAYTSTGKKGFGMGISIGHSWLSFDPENGWQTDKGRAPAGLKTNITQLQTADDGTLWAVSEKWFSEVDSGIGPGPHQWFLTHDWIFRYDGNQAVLSLDLPHKSVTALAMPSQNSGLAWTDINMGWGADALWSYDGQDWVAGAVPAGLEGGAVGWFWFTSADHGYATWYSSDWSVRRFYEINGGDWTEMTAPAGCEEVRPTQGFAIDGYAIAIDTLHASPSFWEMRDNEWQCRTLDFASDEWEWNHAVVTTDHRAYVAMAESSVFPKLVEIGADSASEIALPEGQYFLAGVHVLGDYAPPVSYEPSRQY